MSTQTSTKGLNIALWIVQGLLAALFIMIGGMKLFSPAEKLAEMSHGNPIEMLRFIGLSELLGGIGLILPALLRIMPKLTPLAATGLAIIMVLATGLHASKGEPFIFPAVLGLVAIFIIWGRWKAVPISAK